MENNKKKILDEINNLYNDVNLSIKELELIEKVSESDKFTNEAIELMQTQRSKYNDIIPTKEGERRKGYGTGDRHPEGQLPQLL